MVSLHRALIRALAATTLLCAAALQPTAAQDRAGEFDFYVLALSWAPSYCGNARRPDPAQCDQGPNGFVVHGLWPQHERGWPEYCESQFQERLPASVVIAHADLMPSASAANYQWRKHGRCSGLSPNNYFGALRRAMDRVTIPETFVERDEHLVTSNRSVEAEFIEANPGLSEYAMAVSCNRDGVVEVRICLSKRMEFRRCTEVDRRACRMRPLRLEAAD